MTNPRTARVLISKNGPYVVSGRVPLSKQTIVVDATGNSEKWVESNDTGPKRIKALSLQIRNEWGLEWHNHIIRPIWRLKDL